MKDHNVNAATLAADKKAMRGLGARYHYIGWCWLVGQAQVTAD